MAEQKHLYQHFNPSEQELVEKLLDLVDRMEAYYHLQLTDFLDPRQIEVARSVLGQAGVTYYSSSDYYPLEYARVILAPDYYVLDVADFELTLLEISYASKFNQLSHSQILGSLLKGLGLKRQVIGDILVAQGRAQVVVSQSMADYISLNTERMARTGVKLQPQDFANLLVVTEETRSYQLLLSSLRLDKLVAAVTKQSRNQAQDLIEKGRVKVNYREAMKATEQVTVGDLISIRGHGRLLIKDFQGLTKNQKHKVIIEETIKLK